MQEAETPRPRRSPCAEHQRNAPASIPARRASVEIGEETVDVRIAADERRSLAPDDVDRADRLCGLVQPVEQGNNRFLVWDGDVATRIGTVAKPSHEDGKLCLVRLGERVASVDTEFMKPETVNGR